MICVNAGISSLADRPQDVANYLSPLFEHAKNIIPPSQLSTTPVYILATAGMRLLTDSQSSTILSQACAYIQSSSTPFHIRSCTDQVRIISGEEEGIYGWVAVNYLMDGFDSHGLSSKGTGRHSSTYGFLDMGGASTQLAFEPSTMARKEHADNLLSVNLRLLDGMDVHHPVFVTTWLGYGTNQARERYVDANIKRYVEEYGEPFLLSSSSSSSSPSSPSSSDEEEKPLTRVDDPCLPKDLLLTEPRHPSYISHGTGNFIQCLKQSSPLLNSEQDCSDFPCLMGVHVPPIDFKVNHFIGISEYWYSTQDLWKLGGVYDFPTFEKSAVDYCARDWTSIVNDEHHRGEETKTKTKTKTKKKKNALPDLHRLEMQCFKAAWIINVLHDGIGIPRLKIDKGGEGGQSNGTEEALKKANEKGFIEDDHQQESLPLPPSFQSVNEINNVAVSWTLGRMVLEVTDSIPKSSKSLDHDHDDDAGTPVFEWKNGHESHSSWRQSISDYYRSSSIQYQKQSAASTAALVMILVMAGLAYYFLCSSGSRRRVAWFKKGAFARPQRDDYGMLSMEEGGNNNTNNGAIYGNLAEQPDDNDGDIPSPRKTSNPISRTLLPFRILASRIIPASASASSIIPRLQRSTSNPFLPFNTRRPSFHTSSSLSNGLVIWKI